MDKTTTLALSSASAFTSQIECHHCHVKGHIVSHFSSFFKRALVIDCEDSLLENTDELLVMDPLEPDYVEDLSVMYIDDSP